MIDLTGKKVVIVRFFDLAGWRARIENENGGMLFTSPMEKEIQTAFIWAINLVEKYGCVVIKVIDK